MQRQKLLIRIAFGAVGVVAAALLILALADFRGFAERRMSAALGRPVTIGALDVDIFPLEFVARDVKVPPRDGEDQPALDAKLIEARIAFWRLVFGDIVLPRLVVAETTGMYARDADGRTNWSTADKDAVPAQLPEIRDLTLRDVRIRVRDAGSKSDLQFDLSTSERTEGREPTLHVKGFGNYQGARTTIAGTGGSILTLRSAETPYPIDLNFASGDTRITAKGAVTDPVNIAGLNIALNIEGKDTADLYRLFGIALPASPPYTFTSHLDRAGQKWIAKNLVWKLGSTAMDGTLTWDVSQRTPRLEGNLHAATLDMKDMAGFIGGAPGSAETPTEVRRQAAQKELNRRTVPGQQQPVVAAELVIPDKPIDLEKLKSMNARVGLVADKVTSSGIPLDTLTAELGLESGKLTLSPLRFGIDPGYIAMDIKVDGNAQPVRVDIAGQVQAYPIKRLIGKSGDKLANTTFGAIGGRFEMHGTGNSAHRVAASSDGGVGLIAGGGQLSLLFVEFAGLDLAESLGLLIGKDKPVDIRCGVADFKIKQGVMTTDTFVVDTTDTIFRGEGAVDLGRELMDMKIRPKPKDISLVTLRAPILVKGTFAQPHVGPDMSKVIAKGGLATALGVLLTPLASLLATLDIGGGKDANCSQLFLDVSPK
ncbi:MAG: AsmA family protein [Rhodospirillaceae bacterium]